MTTNSLPKYSVPQLNTAIGSLLERGFAPRFIVEGSVSKPQKKKGHLWLSLFEENTSINAVIWSSKLEKLNYQPEEGDQVIVIGKLNFWATRASLTINILDIKPSIKTILRKFEIVKEKLTNEGIIDPSKRKHLPAYPSRIAILTSVPSSALADMLRTAKERWPLTDLIVIPIPVQGEVSNEIKFVLDQLSKKQSQLKIEAIVIARGGGSREDLMVFDDELLCRTIAQLTIPVVTGLGHEDDLTVTDLVADYRAATPTAAIVALLTNKESARIELSKKQDRLTYETNKLLHKKRYLLSERHTLWEANSPLQSIKNYHINLAQKHAIIEALSPHRWLNRGFSIVQNKYGKPIKSISEVDPNQEISILLKDGIIDAQIKSLSDKQ